VGNETWTPHRDACPCGRVCSEVLFIIDWLRRKGRNCLLTIRKWATSLTIVSVRQGYEGHIVINCLSVRKISFNIVLQSIRRSPKRSLLSGFPTNILDAFLMFTCVAYSAHVIDLTLWSSSLCNLFRFPLNFSSTRCSQFTVWPSLKVTNQV
jgi:hypothetical protein